MRNIAPVQKSFAGSQSSLNLLSSYKSFWSHAFVLSLVINVLAFAVPIHMLQVYDRVLSSGHLETLWVITGAVFVALMFQGALDSFRSRLLFGLAQVFEKTWRSSIFSLLLRDAAWKRQFNTLSPWAMLQNVKQYIASPWMGAVLDLPWVPLYLLVIYWFHPIMGLTALVGALLMVAIAYTNHHRTNDFTVEMLNQSQRARESMDLSFRQAEAIHGLGMQQEALHAWLKQLDEYNTKAAESHVRTSGASAFSKFFRLFLQVAVLSVGAYLVLRNEMSPGAIIANSILLSRALAPIELIASGWKNTQEMWVALKRLSSLPIHSDTLANEETTLNSLPSGALNAEGLYLHLGQPPKPLIKGVGFALEPSDVLAIIGPSGSGKTTLLRMLLGIIEPTGGTCRFDGSEATAYGANFFKQHVGYLPQQVMLFPGTVAENIARLGPVDNDKLMAATQLAGCHDMIMQLPEGYETRLGLNTPNLSLGQQQRIGLARAVYGEPRYLFLDEPNANLDAEGDAALLQAIEEAAAKGTTIICIAHRSSVLKHCSKILMLRQGQVLSFGPRDDVLKKLAASAQKT
jgi:PrtD family type I secretion system ABC transporter